MLLSYLAAWRILPYLVAMILRSGMVRDNWQGKRIPAITGVIFPLVLSITVLPCLWTEERSTVPLFLLAILGAAVAGLIDDLSGSSYPRGLLPHFRYFFLQKKLSTGLVKVILISSIAGWVVFLSGGKKIEIILDWLLLVLTVNSINLLDLRPGRALKGTIFLFIWPALFVPERALLFAALGVIFAYAPYDLQGKAMLGDTGSNVLGMIGGLLLLATPLWVRLIFLFLLIALHVVTEKYSLSILIEKNPWFKRIDEWGRGSLIRR